MQYWDAQGRLHDTEDKGKISLGQNLVNQARAGLTNLNSWINETNPNSDAYKQKTSIFAGLATLPFGAGAGGAGATFVTNSLKPYVGRKLAQMITEGIGGGAIGGLVEGALDSGLHNENIIQGALKGSAMGATAGGLGGYGLGKIGQGLARKGVSKSAENATQYFNDYIDDLADKSKVMNDFRGLKAGVSGQGDILDDQIAWHGSPYDFDEFSNDAIGSGEGNQVHGVGHYVALDKDIANRRYKERLSPKRISNDLAEAGYNWEDITNLENLNLPEDTKSFLMALNNDDYLGFDNPYDAIKASFGKNFENFDPSSELQEAKKTYGTLYKTSIPDDDVFLREDLEWNKQPKAVQEAMIKYFKTRPEEYYNPDPNAGLGDSLGDRFYKEVVFQMQREGAKNPQAAASKLLNEMGIKGISYNGGIDGEARVIFNPDDIKILEKNGQLVNRLLGE